MKSLKEMLKAMSDKAIEALAVELWESYEDDGEDGIWAYLDVSSREASKMLDCTVLDEIPTPADLADCMKVYRAGESEEAYLRAELRRLKAREASIKERLKVLAEENKKEKPEVLDPYKVFNHEGEEELRKKLEGLDAEALKEIIKAHRLDTARRSARWKEDRLVDLIMDMVKRRCTMGDIFRNYKD